MDGRLNMATPTRIGSEVAGYRIAGARPRRHGLRLRGRAPAAQAQGGAEDARARARRRTSDFRERFIRESQTVASIDHPNIIPIYDAGELDGLVYIAMRYVKGPDLEKLLEADGTLDVGRRRSSILEQVAGALDAAHAHDSSTAT